MTITMELSELKNLIADAAELGAARYKREEAPAVDLISQNEAYERFTRAWVEQKVKEGLITPHRNGATPNSKRYYSLTDLREAWNGEKLRAKINGGALYHGRRSLRD